MTDVNGYITAVYDNWWLAYVLDKNKEADEIKIHLDHHHHFKSQENLMYSGFLFMMFFASCFVRLQADWLRTSNLNQAQDYTGSWRAPLMRPSRALSWQHLELRIRRGEGEGERGGGRERGKREGEERGGERGRGREGGGEREGERGRGEEREGGERGKREGGKREGGERGGRERERGRERVRGRESHYRLELREPQNTLCFLLHSQHLTEGVGTDARWGSRHCYNLKVGVRLQHLTQRCLAPVGIMSMITRISSPVMPTLFEPEGLIHGSVMSVGLREEGEGRQEDDLSTLLSVGDTLPGPKPTDEGRKGNRTHVCTTTMGTATLRIEYVSILSKATCHEVVSSITPPLEFESPARYSRTAAVFHNPDAGELSATRWRIHFLQDARAGQNTSTAFSYAASATEIRIQSPMRAITRPTSKRREPASPSPF
ncbi:hypothetical protein PR048_009527 [Dryococelus australis]|uniref:Uncharacterized protein n=1 Tax=Dryococelus australis TaxID=614101 RepID=A0ABQ9I052_9NEOP|nr:hypothetical protein PR048_009527 [Dryococelus australis]